MKDYSVVGNCFESRTSVSRVCIIQNQKGNENLRAILRVRVRSGKQEQEGRQNTLDNLATRQWKWAGMQGD